MLSSRYYSASRLGTDAKPRTAMVVDEDDELYAGFNEVAPALDTRNLREDHDFQETLRTTAIGRKLPSRMGTGVSVHCSLFSMTVYDACHVPTKSLVENNIINT